MRPNSARRALIACDAPMLLPGLFLYHLQRATRPTARDASYTITATLFLQNTSVVVSSTLYSSRLRKRKITYKKTKKILNGTYLHKNVLKHKRNKYTQNMELFKRY